VSREDDLNVVGGDLLPCSEPESTRPVTGFYRDGCCATGPEDVGSHTVCSIMTADFLEFQQAHGQRLSNAAGPNGASRARTGRPVVRVRQPVARAYDAGRAPAVVLGATHARALEIVPIEALIAHALQPEPAE